MNDTEVRQEIQIIRNMVEKSRRSTAESGGFYVFWGILIIAAMAGTIILESLRLYRWITLAWTAAVAVGWIYSFVRGFQRARTRKTETYAETTARYLGIACGTGFLLACFLFPLLKIYPYGTIPMAFSLIAGILFFVLGGIYEWNFLKWIGLAWWLGSIGLSLLAEIVRNMAFLALFIGCYFIPSLIIWRKYRRAQRNR